MRSTPPQPIDAPLAGGPRRADERWELAAGGEPLPSWRDRSMQAVLLVGALLLGLSWHLHEGYPLADAVEYMERAQSFARGETQDAANAVRSFGFSLLLAPIFLAEELFGITNEIAVVGAVRVLQIAIALGLVLVCARIGARLAGRRAGLAAGWLVAVNPVFLQYGISPISGVASALFVGLGLERLMLRGPPRRAFAGGLALGAAFLMAYQSLVIALPILALALLRDRRAAWRAPACAVLGLLLAILFQVWLDRVTWGAWGVSVGSYLLENVRGIIVTFVARLGLRETALWLYERMADFVVVPTGGPPRQLVSRAFYFTELHTMLVWPVMALGALGLLRAARRPAWPTSILALVLAANVAAMSLKGDKSFRLWLPLLPMIAPLCAYGLALVWSVRGERFAFARASVALLALIASAVLGVRQLLAVNTRPHGAYWSAAEMVNRAVERESEDNTARLASAYHWAVFHRQSPRVELVKLPHHLHAWTKLDEAQRAACIERLDTLDWLVTHRPVLEQERSLFDAIAARFEVHDFAWEDESDPSLGPIVVLRRRSGSGEARLLCGTSPSEDPSEYRRRLGLDRALPEPLDFLGQSVQGGAFDQRLTLLGFEYARLPDSGCGWITYHWTSPTGLARPAIVVDRITPPDGAHAWHNNHPTCYGFRPSDAWAPGEIVREGYPVLPGNDPFTERFAPMGGAYRRGDLIPVELWFQVVHAGPDGAYEDGLRPARFGAPRPLDPTQSVTLPGDRRRGSDGLISSADGLVRAARFLLPVPPRYRWPDDGRGDPP